MRGGSCAWKRYFYSIDDSFVELNLPSLHGETQLKLTQGWPVSSRVHWCWAEGNDDHRFIRDAALIASGNAGERGPFALKDSEDWQAQKKRRLPNMLNAQGVFNQQETSLTHTPFNNGLTLMSVVWSKAPVYCPAASCP